MTGFTVGAYAVPAARARHLGAIFFCLAALATTSCGSAENDTSAQSGGSAQTSPPPQSGGDEGKIVGFAFVDAAVTGQGSAAQLPASAKIFPPGSKVTGTEGCPTNQYRTDGLIVAVIDYRGRPTAGSVTISLMPAPQFGGRPPYYLDLNTGRTLQFLGPVFDNGSYKVTLDYFFGQAQQKSTSAEFTLERSCPG